MKFEKTQLNEVFFGHPEIFEDNRGVFYESFRADDAERLLDRPFTVIQSNVSVSARGVIRGFHMQKTPMAQSKYISVFSGAIYDVAIDLRPNSRTYGDWQGFMLSAAGGESLLLGQGIGHAFIALEDNSRMLYLVDQKYSPAHEVIVNPLSAGVNWKAVAGIDNNDELTISGKDSAAEGLREFMETHR